MWPNSSERLWKCATSLWKWPSCKYSLTKQGSVPTNARKIWWDFLMLFVVFLEICSLSHQVFAVVLLHNWGSGQQKRQSHSSLLGQSLTQGHAQSTLHRCFFTWCWSGLQPTCFLKKKKIVLQLWYMDWIKFWSLCGCCFDQFLSVMYKLVPPFVVQKTEVKSQTDPPRCPDGWPVWESEIYWGSAKEFPRSTQCCQ